MTDALRDQQERSLSLEAVWALDLVAREQGQATGLAGPRGFFGTTVGARQLYDDYVEFARSRKGRPLPDVTFGKYLTRVGVPIQRKSSLRQRQMPSAHDFAEMVRKDAGVHA
jgi:hypothetical protein